MNHRDFSIAVMIPCLNEEAAIGQVVNDFRRALPSAEIFVYDNASDDNTAQTAHDAGAIVRHEPTRGKGNVVHRMFNDIDADIFVLVDGDGTYPAREAPEMIAALLKHQLDMVSGARYPAHAASYRRGHRMGNAFFTRLVGLTFGRHFSDILSGYRIMSRRFVKSFPALSSGFEIETEIAVHALEMRLPSMEIPVPYFARHEGSTSKLRTIRDGMAIARTILALVKEEKPLVFFSIVCVMLELTSLGLAWPIATHYLSTGLVPRLPTAVLSTGLALLGFLSLTCGLILDSIARGRREVRRLHYLAVPGLTIHGADDPPGMGQAVTARTARRIERSRR